MYVYSIHFSDVKKKFMRNPRIDRADSRIVGYTEVMLKPLSRK